MDFERIHNTPEIEQRRVGSVGLALGGALVYIGLLMAAYLVRVTDLPMNNLFGIVAGVGGVIAGINAYRIGLSFFPAMKGSSRGASFARMSFVLMTLVLLGGVFLFFVLEDG